MFKGILPSKRISTSEFTMVTSLGDISNGKENLPSDAVQPAKPPKAPANKSKSKTPQNTTGEPQVTSQAFEKLLVSPVLSSTRLSSSHVLFHQDELQIPSTLRPKLAGMDASVKAAMLKSSRVLNVSIPQTSSPRTLRKARSIESIVSPYSHIGHDGQSRRGGLWGNPLAGKSSVDLHSSEYVQDRSHHGRGTSLDASGTLGRSQTPAAIPGDLMANKAKDRSFGKMITPVKFCSTLCSTSSTTLEVDLVKKLRMMLRNESARYVIVSRAG